METVNLSIWAFVHSRIRFFDWLCETVRLLRAYISSVRYFGWGCETRIWASEYLRVLACLSARSCYAFILLVETVRRSSELRPLAISSLLMRALAFLHSVFRLSLCRWGRLGQRGSHPSSCALTRSFAHSHYPFVLSVVFLLSLLIETVILSSELLRTRKFGLAYALTRIVYCGVLLGLLGKIAKV